VGEVLLKNIMRIIDKKGVLVLIIILILVIARYESVREVKADEIKDTYMVEDRNIERIDNLVLINNGSKVVEMENIFDIYKNELGGVFSVVKAHSGGYLFVTAKVVDPLPKETPAHLRRYKIKITKVSEEGKLMWSRIYGYRGMNRNNCKEVKRTKDGGYIIVGECSEGMSSDDLHKLMVVKLNGRGVVEWEKIWSPDEGESSSLWGVSVMEVKGGYVVVSTNTWGGISSKDKEHNYVMKLDGNGVRKWRRDLNDKGKYYYSINRGYINSLGNIVILLSKIENSFVYVEMGVKKGEIKREISYNLDQKYGELSFYEVDVLEINKGSKIIAGQISDDKKRKEGIFVMKEEEGKGDKSFRIFWNGNNECIYRGIIEDKEDNYIIYGRLDYDWRDMSNSIFMIRLNGNGIVKGMHIFDIGNDWNDVYWMGLDNEGELVGVFDWSTDNGGYNEYGVLAKVRFR